MKESNRKEEPIKAQLKAENQEDLKPLLNKIYNEDCLKGMKRIPDKSIDMILCDLPYGTTQNKWDTIIPFEPLWEQYERIIKNNGAIVLTATQPFSSELVCSNKKLFKYEWIWQKSKITGVLNAKRQPVRQHEQVLVFYKNQPEYNPQGLIPYNKEIKQGSSSKNYGKRKTSSYTQSHTGYPRSVLAIKSEGKSIHPTQKPTSLFEYLIKTYTTEEAVVLDNCMGSGTTAIACLNTNRKYIGFELDNAYFEIAKLRTSEYQEVSS